MTRNHQPRKAEPIAHAASRYITRCTMTTSSPELVPQELKRPTGAFLSSSCKPRALHIQRNPFERNDRKLLSFSFKNSSMLFLGSSRTPLNCVYPCRTFEEPFGNDPANFGSAGSLRSRAMSNSFSFHFGRYTLGSYRWGSSLPAWPRPGYLLVGLLIETHNGSQLVTHVNIGGNERSGNLLVVAHSIFSPVTPFCR